jgi:hypothetical protein
MVESSFVFPGGRGDAFLLCSIDGSPYSSVVASWAWRIKVF